MARGASAAEPVSNNDIISAGLAGNEGPLHALQFACVSLPVLLSSSIFLEAQLTHCPHNVTV